MVAPTIVSKGRLAVNSLRKAEESALDGTDNGGGNGFYTGSGRESSGRGSKRKGKLKTKIAGAVIIAMLTGGGIFLGTTNSMLAPAIEALFTEQTDTQYASASMRSTRLMRFMVEGDDVITTNKWTGAKKYGKMSKSFKKRLSDNGITVEGKGKNAKLRFEYMGKDGIATSYTINADDFAKTYKSDTDFREAFQTARRGRVATFFDNTATKVFQKLGISRNVFANYKRSSSADVNTENFRKTMTDQFNGGETSIRQTGKNTLTDENGDIITDENGKPKTTDIDASESATHTSTTSADAEAKAKSMVKGVADKFTSIGMGVGAWTCTVLRVMSMISVMVAANEIYQSINYFMDLTENISKMKNGDGDASAVNEVMNFLTTTSTTKTTEFGKLQIAENNNGDDGSVSNDAGTVKQTGSPLESNGMQMILAGAALSTVENRLFSLERIGNSTFTTSNEKVNKVLGLNKLNAAVSSPKTNKVCNTIDGASAVVSIGMSIASFGGTKIVTKLASFVVGAAASVLVSAALSFLVPTIAKVLFTNAFENATGIPAGALFTKGASAANTRLGRNASGQSLSSEEAAVAYNKVNQEVVALDAEIDRKNLSPFDTTNKNTFFGSIAYSMMPLITKTKISNLSVLLNTTTTSLGSLMGNNVSAAGKGTSYMTKFGNCKTLASIGAKGDNYCNPVTSTDTSTLTISPNNEKYQEVINDAMLDDDGGKTCDDNGDGCKINPKSDLAKYITYCANRDSPFGVVDQNILGELHTSDEKLGAFRGIAGAVPFLGDGLDILDAIQDQANESWATGEKCGNTENNKDFWSKQGKYYQRFIEDTRLLEQMGAYEEETSPLTAYTEEYEETHPIDETYVGYMSRISGLLPENVETAIAFIEYYLYIDNYDPTERIAMTNHPSSVDTSAEIIAKAEIDKGFSQKPPRLLEQIIAVVRPAITYNDIRNRSFAI